MPVPTKITLTPDLASVYAGGVQSRDAAGVVTMITPAQFADQQLGRAAVTPVGTLVREYQEQFSVVGLQHYYVLAYAIALADGYVDATSDGMLAWLALNSKGYTNSDQYLTFRLYLAKATEAVTGVLPPLPGPLSVLAPEQRSTLPPELGGEAPVNMPCGGCGQQQTSGGTTPGTPTGGGVGGTTTQPVNPTVPGGGGSTGGVGSTGPVPFPSTSAPAPAPAAPAGNGTVPAGFLSGSGGLMSTITVAGLSIPLWLLLLLLVIAYRLWKGR
jgi:hypothetical protein